MKVVETYCFYMVYDDLPLKILYAICLWQSYEMQYTDPVRHSFDGYNIKLSNTVLMKNGDKKRKIRIPKGNADYFTIFKPVKPRRLVLAPPHVSLPNGLRSGLFLDTDLSGVAT